MLLFDVELLKFEHNVVDVVDADNKWNRVEVSCADHNTNDKVQRLVAKYSDIHVFKQTNVMQDIQFSHTAKRMKNVTLDPNSEGPSKRINVKISFSFTPFLLHSSSPMFFFISLLFVYF